MKKHLMLTFPGLLFVGFVFCQSTNKNEKQEVILTNTSSVALTDKAIAIKKSNLKNIPKGTVYPLLLSSANDTLPAQLDDLDGDGKWDELFFVVNLPANGTRAYSLHWITTMPMFQKRTSVRFGKRSSATTPVQPATSETLYRNELPKSLGFQRYQTDGPSWENDKVGFRHYLDGRNAKDVFGKLVSDMSPENVGINAKGEVEDNYHVMEKWGRDILAVGNSVGIGGIALIDKDQLLRLGVTVDDSINNVEKTSFKIVTEGPVRSVMNFKYENWQPAGNRKYNVEETVSIWPGMYAYQNSVKVAGLTGTENLGIGIVNINAEKAPTEIKVGDKWVALISHEKHAYNKEWWIGLALILPAAEYLGYVQAPKTGKLANTYLAKLKISNNQLIQYYAVAAWELSDQGFKEAAYFQQYVENLAKQLAAEVKVTIK
ncbi:MAG: DUF4861 domain-containing protein [Flavisolibacter sp.]|nr:DUF4861 domain-containing protein [Flavisolibacter sp.]